MNDYSKKYKKMVDKLVKKSFSKLRGKWIIVVSTQMNLMGINAFFIPFGFGGLIVVFEKSKNFNEIISTSLFAHELSHYETLLNMKFLEKIKSGFSWLFTKKGKADFETLADKYAISKGYGKGLYDMRLKIEKKRSKEGLLRIKNHGYLSSKQIKTYAQKIGKW